MMTFLEELFANKVMMLAMDYVSKPVSGYVTDSSSIIVITLPNA